jgi:molybdopterin converting factor small subunit
MSINLELIDELKKRANVSYEDARDALEKCNGDIVEALIYLEKEKKIKPENNENTNSFFTKIKKIIIKGNNINFIVKKKDKIILSLPVTVVVIITIFAPYISVFGVLLALLTGHRIKFQGKNGDDMKVNETLDKVSDTVDNVKRKLMEDDVNEASTSK